VCYSTKIDLGPIPRQTPILVSSHGLVVDRITTLRSCIYVAGASNDRVR